MRTLIFASIILIPSLAYAGSLGIVGKLNNIFSGDEFQKQQEELEYEKQRTEKQQTKSIDRIQESIEDLERRYEQRQYRAKSAPPPRYPTKK